MRNTMIAVLAGMMLGVAGTWLVLGAAVREAPPAAALPELPAPWYQVLFENDAVRIVDHRLAPGESEPEHTHPPMLAWFVSGATVQVTEADGTVAEVTIPTGAFLGADRLEWWTHALTNTGDTPLHSILVELKGKPAGR